MNSLSDFYMETALRYGKVELKPGVELYSAQGIKNLIPGFTPDNDYYIMKGNKFSECYGPENVYDILEHTDQGFIPPITYHGTKGVT